MFAEFGKSHQASIPAQELSWAYVAYYMQRGSKTTVMKGFIRLTNVYQDAPTILHVANICYFYRQDTGVKHTVIICNGLEHGVSVQEDYEQVLRLIEEAIGDKE